MGKKNHLKSLPKTIWAVGVVTLLMNMSTVIVFSLSPIYMTSVLGISIAGLGNFEGLVESLAWVTRLFAGIISDYLHRRKLLLIIASSFTALARPLFAMSTTIPFIFMARSMDRIGNGLQATPREALVGDAAPKNLKGASFGLRQALSVFGSMIGALMVFLWSMQDNPSYSRIFWIASIPPFLGLLVLLFFVKDSPHRALEKSPRSFRKILHGCTHLNQGYWRVILMASVFMVSNYSGAFLILRVTDGCKDIQLAALVMIVQNLASMVFAYPAGRLADKIDRRWILATGFFLAILSNTVLAYRGGGLWGLIGAALWGAQMGTVQSLIMTKIADHTQQDLRATAYGIYYVLVAFSVVAANKIMSYCYDVWGPSYGFHASSLAIVLAFCLLPFVKPAKTLKH